MKDIARALDAASGVYIDRMSDYCIGCTHKSKLKLGPQACPFNYLYWYFLIINQTRLKPNPRMGMSYAALSRMTAERRREIIQCQNVSWPSWESDPTDS